METLQLGLLDKEKPAAIEPAKKELKPVVPYCYQKKAIDETYRCVSDGFKKICVIILMGGGKSLLSAWMIRDAIRAGKKCIFLVHYDTLIQQSVDEFKRLGLKPDIIKGKKTFNKNASILVASVQTLEAQLRLSKKSLVDLIGHRDLIVEDECHELSFRDLRNAFEEAYFNAIFIGLSATPYRLSKKQWLGQKYETSVSVIQPPDLIKLGKVVPCRPYALPNVFDADKLTTNGKDGDYTDSSVGRQASTERVRTFVVAQYLKICPDAPAIMVGSTVAQAELQCDSFNKAGIPSETITGTTTTAQRVAIFERTRLGITKVICSVGTLTAGVSLNWISCILFVRITKSKARFFQVAGRGCRCYDNKDFYWLLDFGGNLKSFGNPMDYQDYSIDGELPEETAAPEKDCPECGHTQRVFNVECEKCGYKFSQGEDEEYELILNDLAEYFDSFTKRKLRCIHDSKRAAYRNYTLTKQPSPETSPDYAIEQFKSLYGHIPPAEWQLNAVLGIRYSKLKMRDYLSYLKAHVINKKYAKRWINHHYKLETGEDMPAEQLDLLIE